MTDFEPVGWNVPADEFDRFTKWVGEKHDGYTAARLGFEVEEAMRAFLDEDAGASVETTSKALLEAPGHSSDATGEKTPSGETRHVACRINPELKRRFRSRVDKLKENRDSRDRTLTYGRALGIALRDHRDGGRWRRVGDDLDRIRDDVEAVLSELDEDGDGLTGREKKRLKIRRRLSDMGEFTQYDLEDVIADVAGETVIDDYRPTVLEEMDVVEHPATRDNPDKTSLYLPPSKAKEIARSRAEDRRAEAEDTFEAFEAGAAGGSTGHEPQGRTAETGVNSTDSDAVHGKAATDGGRDTATDTVDDHADGQDDDSDGSCAAGVMSTDEADETDEADQDDQEDEATDTDTDGEGPADVDGDGEPAEIRADGGVVTATADCPPSSPTEPSGRAESSSGGASGPPARLSCPCCGTLVPTSVPVERRRSDAVKECPRCRGAVDLETATPPPED